MSERVDLVIDGAGRVVGTTQPVRLLDQAVLLLNEGIGRRRGYTMRGEALADLLVDLQRLGFDREEIKAAGLWPTE